MPVAGAPGYALPAQSAPIVQPRRSGLASLFLGEAAPPCLAAANTNGDGGVDITDPIYLLAHLFLGSTPPPAPFPSALVPEPPIPKAPANSPPPEIRPSAVAEMLTPANGSVLAAPSLKERFAAGGLEPLSTTPEEFRELLRSEIPRWKEVARLAKIQVE